ncbi:MAG: copper amine oxidase N-terminal domain-containing protein [Candidatus Eremiobacteraeota bacterium]|nr:copper amine oxidase N-terminal domain-containing protein [Candidatus Eremiobacteraeota bacterium]
MHLFAIGTLACCLSGAHPGGTRPAPAVVRIFVNDRALAVAALVDRGHVLVPMRPLFVALGASVRYRADGRRIEARSALHRIDVVIGANDAQVDARRVPLETPARIVGSSAFVPLRFVAAGLGATVDYEPALRRVIVLAHPATRVLSLTPAPQARVAIAYPTISATFAGTSPVAAATVRLQVDGVDVTPMAAFTGNGITYIPREPMPQGAHSVSVAGVDDAGTPFAAAWSFESTAGAQSGGASAPNDAWPGTTFAFYLEGGDTFYRGDFMRFTLVAPPGGSAQIQLCGLPYSYALWSGYDASHYRATVPAPLGYLVANCPVTAIYTAWNGTQTIVPYPVYVSLFTAQRNGLPQSTPAPGQRGVPELRRLPPEPRRSESPPVPRPVFVQATPRPAITPAPVPATPRPATPRPPERTPLPRPHDTAAPI